MSMKKRASKRLLESEGETPDITDDDCGQIGLKIFEEVYR